MGETLNNLNSQNQVAGLPLLGIWADPRLEQPYQLQTNVGWSHALTANTVIGVDYVNSIGRDLNYKPRVNQFVPGTGAAPRRLSTLLSSNLSPNNSQNRPALSRGRSEYNALIFSGRRRFARGYDFSASYMLSKAVSTIGNASDELNTGNIQDPNDPFDNPVQLGPNVTTDARHRINVSAVVQLPYGIQVAPFLLYRSALPIFLIDGRDLNKDGDTLDIPTDAYAVASTDPLTGKSTVKIIGACETVNCGRGWGQSQLNLRLSKVFSIGRARLEAIGEVFNLFNAINPSNIVARHFRESTGEYARPGRPTRRCCSRPASRATASVRSSASGKSACGSRSRRALCVTRDKLALDAQNSSRTPAEGTNGNSESNNPKA